MLPAPLFPNGVKMDSSMKRCGGESPRSRAGKENISNAFITQCGVPQLKHLQNKQEPVGWKEQCTPVHQRTKMKGAKPTDALYRLLDPSPSRDK